MADNPKQPTPPDLTSLLDEQKRDVQVSINCVQIGTIQSFDTANQLATISISMKQVEQINEDGSKVLKEYPLLLECPVMVLFGGVDVLTMPIASGDNCIVLFNDRDIDSWVAAGDGQYPVTQRVHDLNDAFAIVGIRPLTNSIANYLANGIRLSHGIGNSQIDLKTDLIESIADLFLHNGDMTITKDLRVQRDFYIEGDTYGNGTTNDWNLRANLIQESGFEIHDGRGVSGTFDVVTVVDGIVVSGS
jgi:hypothetical protein